MHTLPLALLNFNLAQSRGFSIFLFSEETPDLVEKGKNFP